MTVSTAAPRPVEEGALSSGATLSRVIVRASDLSTVEATAVSLGGSVGRRLSSIGAVVVQVPSRELAKLAALPAVTSVSVDRPIRGTLGRAAAAVGARWVAENLGFDGSGVGVAIVDSGVAAGHDDLRGNRIVQFVDFVSFQPQPHDRYGHGTHVAGIIAGSGHDSNGARRGVAPGAHLVVLKTLDALGHGFISNAIAAMDYAIEQRATFNIRVLNLSVAAGVYESYKTDPLTLAAGRAVDAGIVVVTAAGNHGVSAKGERQHGGITAPGNAPWVITVGAASHNGTVDRADDVMASFSSLGPSAIDLEAKPDLVAPGVGIESLAESGSTLFNKRGASRLWGTVGTREQPYLSLSGTSMAAPIVAGTVALMLEANPALQPDEVKAILRASAERKSAYEAAAQGAGFLDARGAVQLAQRFADRPGPGRLQRLVDQTSDTAGAWVGRCRHVATASCLAAERNVVWAASAGWPAEMLGGAALEPDDRAIWTATQRRPARRRHRAARAIGKRPPQAGAGA